MLEISANSLQFWLEAVWTQYHAQLLVSNICFINCRKLFTNRGFQAPNPPIPLTNQYWNQLWLFWMLPGVLSAIQRGEEEGGGGWVTVSPRVFYSVIVFSSVLSEVFSAENVVKDYGWWSLWYSTIKLFC